MLDVILRRFESPDEVREMVMGRFEVLRIGGLTIGRATSQPGWKWSEHVGSGVGADRCSVEHVGAGADRRGRGGAPRPGHRDDGGRPVLRAARHFLGADNYATSK